MTIAEIPTKPGRGGRRPGAGRPRKTAAPSTLAPTVADTPSSSANAEFATQRARHEKIKADQRALKLKIEAGEYVSRAMVRDVAATQLAMLANGLRSIGDHLERCGLEPQWCQRVDEVVDQHLAAISEGMRATYEQAQHSLNEHS